jgi:plastocyanin
MGDGVRAPFDRADVMIASLLAAFALWTGETGGTATAQGQSTVHVITIDALQFSPKTLTLKRGDRVRWVNKDLVPHTVTAQGGSFDSRSIAVGSSWTLLASQTGTFEYVCNFHPTMRGVLAVL